MKATLSVILLMGGMIAVLAGCTNRGLALRDTGPHSGRAPSAGVDRLKNRDAYINSHYEMQLKTGRADNEEEARALASLEWERLKNRGKLETQ